MVLKWSHNLLVHTCGRLHGKPRSSTSHSACPHTAVQPSQSTMLSSSSCTPRFVPYLTSHCLAVACMTTMVLHLCGCLPASSAVRILLPRFEECHYAMQLFVFLPEYAALPADQKAALLETGTCPPGGLPGCDDMRLNFAVDWNLLHPAMQIAFEDMNSKHSHVLDTV